MPNSLPSHKRKSLEGRRASLVEEYEAVSAQLNHTLDAADRLRLQRHLDDLDCQIQEIDNVLAQGPSSKAPAEEQTRPQAESASQSVSPERLPQRDCATEDIQIRREILGLLYEASKSSAFGQMDFRGLVERLSIPRKIVQFHLDYLEKKGWIAVHRSTRGAQILRCYSITPKGIDLVEEPSEFNRELPVVQQIYHYGDTITVGNISNNAVAIGRSSHAELDST